MKIHFLLGVIFDLNFPEIEHCSAVVLCYPPCPRPAGAHCIGAGAGTIAVAFAIRCHLLPLPLLADLPAPCAAAGF